MDLWNSRLHTNNEEVVVSRHGGSSPAGTAGSAPARPGSGPTIVKSVAGACLVMSPLRSVDGELFLCLGGDRFCALRQPDGTTLPSLLPDWTVDALYLGCPRVPWLKLRHEDGHVADWFLDRTGRLVANVYEGLRAVERGWLAAHVRDLFALPPGPEREDAFAAYETMNPVIRAVLERMIPPPSHVVDGEQVRLLLLATQALAAGHAAPPASVRQVELVLPGGEPGSCLGPGWILEDGRAWSTGLSGSIALDGLVPMGRHQVRLSLRDCQGSMLLWMWANDRLVGSAQIDMRWQPEVTSLCVWIPPECVPAGRLELCLRLDRALPTARNYALQALDLSFFDDSLPAVPDNRDLLARFEGIGDNCQFGNVQRHWGIEPLGLLRFAGVRDLHRLFASRFAGLGEPGSLVAYLAGSEYQIRDHEYGLFYHTFRYENEATADEVVAENEAKIRYLIRKLVEDLEDGEKIFVYRRFVEDDLPTVAELHRVLRGYGPVKLLWVTTGAPGRAPGDVEWAGPDLLRGYLDDDASNDPAVFDPDHWIDLLRNAYAAFRRLDRTRPGG